jgi:C4-dicarboxylate transporter DctQ subunit
MNRLLSLFEQTIIAVGLGLATLLMFSNVVMRYLFDSGLPWALEATHYLFAWVVLVGAANGVSTGTHLGIDLLVKRLPASLARVVALIGVGICLGFVITVLVLSIQYIAALYEWGDLTEDLYIPAGWFGLSEEWSVPQWLPYLALPTGLSLMALRFLQLGWGLYSGRQQTLAAAEHSQYEVAE